MRWGNKDNLSLCSAYLCRPPLLQVLLDAVLNKRLVRLGGLGIAVDFWHGTGQFYKQRKSCGDVFSELLVYTSGLHRSANKEWDVQRLFFFSLSSMQIGRRWKLENGAEKLSSAHCSCIPCNFGQPAPCQWSNAHLLLFSGQEREAPVVVMCCHSATSYLSNICCPSKVGQSFNRPEAVALARTASPALFSCSKRGSNTTVSIVDLLQHNPCITPPQHYHHPHPPTHILQGKRQ